jgi:hypothetical protein
MMERRLEGRFLCADLVRVDWLAGSGESGEGEPDMGEQGEGEFRTVEAVLEDICTLGACVQVEEGIPLGTAIRLSARSALVSSAPDDTRETARFSGHVSYCAYRDYGYFVGIRFSDETHWSSRIFAPRHLTNLAALSGKDDSISGNLTEM